MAGAIQGLMVAGTIVLATLAVFASPSADRALANLTAPIAERIYGNSVFLWILIALAIGGIFGFVFLR